MKNVQTLVDAILSTCTNLRSSLNWFYCFLSLDQSCDVRIIQALNSLFSLNADSLTTFFLNDMKRIFQRVEYDNFLHGVMCTLGNHQRFIGCLDLCGLDKDYVLVSLCHQDYRWLTSLDVRLNPKRGEFEILVWGYVDLPKQSFDVSMQLPLHLIITHMLDFWRDALQEHDYWSFKVE